MHGGFGAKVLRRGQDVERIARYCEQEAIPPEAWPLNHMFVEDFLGQYRNKGGSAPRAKYNALVFARRHLQAPLDVGGLRQAIGDAKSRSWRRVISAVAVVAVVKPLKYAHVNRAR